jgi:hypothetical protein
MNEFSCEMFFFGKCLDLIKFAVGTIVNHFKIVLLPRRRFVGNRHTRLIYCPQN